MGEGVTGVLFALFRPRLRLFGGRFRTGEPVEYGMTVVVECICTGLTNLMPDGKREPLFDDWAGHGESGVIDGDEWRMNRFRIFQAMTYPLLKGACALPTLSLQEPYLCQQPKKKRQSLYAGIPG